MKKSDIIRPGRIRQRTVGSQVWLVLVIFVMIAFWVIPACAGNVSVSATNVSGIDGDEEDVALSLLNTIQTDEDDTILLDSILSKENDTHLQNSSLSGGDDAASIPAPILLENASTSENEINAPMTLLQSTASSSVGGVIPAVDDVYLKFANDDGAFFDDFGDDTFHITWSGGGLNSLHISNSEEGDGQVTYTHDQSGTFYVTTTGGRGYQDDIFLCVAVNGTIPENFQLHIQADGYQWVPNPIPHVPPASGTEHYEPVTIDEWFTKDDLIYGPQTWRPAAKMQYPIYPNQDVSDTSNQFQMMFIDLNAGILSDKPLRVKYELRNLRTMAAFNVYGYAKNVLGHSMNEVIYNTTEWTNRLTENEEEFSGWYVLGTPFPDADHVELTPSSPEVPLNGKLKFIAKAFDASNQEIVGTPVKWVCGDPKVGDVTQEGVFIPRAMGSTTVTALVKGASADTTVTVIAPVDKKITTISVDPTVYVFYADQLYNVTFTAHGFDQYGDELVDILFKWSTTNETVGKVDPQSGIFTPRSPGTTIISATNDSISGCAEVEVKERPDWNLELKGEVNETLSRSNYIEISDQFPVSYMDNHNDLWEGVSLTRVLGRVDDLDPENFNETLASHEYTVTLKGKAAGNYKEVNILSSDLLDPEKSFILAYKLNGYEIPAEKVEGRTYWPLKLIGSGVVYSGKTLEEITEISITFGPDVRTVNITPDNIGMWLGDEPVQFTAQAYDRMGIKLEDIKFRWSLSNNTVGKIDENGVFTPLNGGITDVRAYAYGMTGSAKINVKIPGENPATWYVDATGAGDFLTIQDAVDYAYDGDIIVVRDGTYTEKVVVDRPLIIQSANGPEKTVVSPVARSESEFQDPVFNVVSDGVTIKGLGIQNAYDYSGIESSGCQDCIFDNNLITAITGVRWATGIKMMPGNDSVIKNNIISSQNQGVIISLSKSDIIKNNTISGASTGISIQTGSENITVNSNNVETTGKKGRSLRLYGGIDGVHIEGNSISGGRETVYLYDACNVTILSNEITGGGRYAIQLSGCKNVDIWKNMITAGNYAALYGYNFQPGSFSVWLNNIIEAQPSKYGLIHGSMPCSLNSTVLHSYVYMNDTYTGYLGNYFSTYTGTDSDGDGLGDTPFTAGDTDHYHPLVSPIDAYLVLTPTTITITPPAAILEAGESVHFTAEVFDQRGEVMPGAVPVWSSGNTTLGVVNATTGYFDALSPGDVTISASCEGCTESADVMVVPATKKTESVSFEVPDCTFTEDSSGAPFISVNASAAEIQGDRLVLQGDGFDLTVMTTSMEEPAGGRINATYDALVLETDPLVADLPAPGPVSGSIRANLTCLPAGAGITTTLNQTIPEKVMSAFQLAASDAGLEVDEVAFTMNIMKTNLTNGEEINGAVVRMGIDQRWVDAHGGPDAVRIIRWAEDDMKEVLETEYLGLDASGKMVFEGYSPNGFSLFGLVATSSPSAPQPVGDRSSPSDGGRSDVASFAGSIPEGGEQTFSIDRTAIDQITVEAWDELSGFLVTVEKASLPEEIEMPASAVYEIQKTTLYHTDPAAIAGLVLEFSVPKTWLDAHGLSAEEVTLMQYVNDRWRTLPTTLLSEDDEKVYYSAEADRFSYFAIVSGEVVAGEASVPAEETPVPTTREVVQTTETSTPTPTTTAPRQTPVMWGLALVAVGAAVMMRRK